MPAEAREKHPITPNIEENQQYLNRVLGVGVSYDMGAHECNIGDKRCLLYYINGFANSDLVTMIMRDLNDVKSRELAGDVIERLYHKYIPFFQLAKVKNSDEFVDQILAGQVGIVVEGETVALMLDVRKYPSRNPEEPDLERVVRGAHDGFTETLVMNTALTRRRIRDDRLRFEVLQIGERSKTDVAIAYLEDVANPGLVEELRERLNGVKVDGIPMADKTVEEFIIGKTWNPFPVVRYTERPDVAAVHLMEGHVLIYVDTSPSVIITPTTYFHHVQHAEEYRQTPIVGAYLRWIRFFGIVASLILLPLWTLLVLNPGMIPSSLSFLGIKKAGHIPILAQFLLAEVGVDLMRMAAIHTPTPLATAMGLVAAILIGEVAIKAGLFAPEVILYLAVAAIGTFATPSYELSLANRLVRLVLLILVGLLGAPGFVIGIAAVIVLLAMTRSLETPYLWPLIPFNYQAMKEVIIRTTMPSKKLRPSIVKPQNPYRR
jgi:stage V sporulation protein AF